MLKTIALRFVRTFGAGFISGISAYLLAGVPIKDITDIKVLLMPFLFAGLTAGIVALDKAYRYTPPTLPPIDSLPQ
jgi:hypothetical protein